MAKGGPQELLDRPPNEVDLFAFQETYIFIFSDDQYRETVRKVAEFAHREDLSFNWEDAVIAGAKIRMAAEAEGIEV